MKKEDTKVSVDEFGFKTTEEGDEYCLYTFANPNGNPINEYQGLIKDYSGKECKYTSASLSYKNKDGRYESTPFQNRTIGFILNSNYKIYASFKKNTHSNGLLPPLDKDKRIAGKYCRGQNAIGFKNYADECLSAEENELNFLKHLQQSDKRWKNIIMDYLNENVVNSNKIPETFVGKYYKHSQTLNGCKKFVPCSGGYIEANNCRIVYGDRFSADYVNNTEYPIMNEEREFHIMNNEIFLKNLKNKQLDVKSLLINLSNQKNDTRSLKNQFSNSRIHSLTNIALYMNDIIDMQLNTFNHINIPFRDEKDKKISFPTLYEFVAKIKEICKEAHVAIPNNYPSTEKVVELCEKKMEEKFQNKINKIFGKKKRCFFKDNSHELLNERNSCWEHSLFIKRVNEIYDEILMLRDNIKDIKDVAGTIDCVESNDINTYKSIVYVNNMLLFYNAISEYEKLMKTTDEEKNVGNSLSEKSLNSIDESKMRV